jgi:hypothetical protein
MKRSGVDQTSAARAIVAFNVVMSAKRLCGASHISRGIMNARDHLACTCKSSRSDIADT